MTKFFTRKLVAAEWKKIIKYIYNSCAFCNALPIVKNS